MPPAPQAPDCVVLAMRPRQAACTCCPGRALGLAGAAQGRYPLQQMPSPGPPQVPPQCMASRRPPSVPPPGSSATRNQRRPSGPVFLALPCSAVVSRALGCREGRRAVMSRAPLSFQNPRPGHECAPGSKASGSTRRQGLGPASPPAAAVASRQAAQDAPAAPALSCAGCPPARGPAAPREVPSLQVAQLRLHRAPGARLP